MNALSADLRRRILGHVLSRGSVRGTARLFRVSPNTVQQLKGLFYATGGVSPRPPKPADTRTVKADGELFIQSLLCDEPDATLARLCELYAAAFGTRVCVPTMSNTLRRMGYSRKKKPSATPGTTAPGRRRGARSTPANWRQSPRKTGSTLTRRAAP